MLVVRGIFTLFKRWLILSERMAPEDDPDERTLETNRALFWRRIRSLAIILGIYFAIYFVFFGLGPLEAMDALPGVIAAAIPQLAYFLVIMVANFMLFFGAFFIYGRIGRNYVDPGEANYEVKIEDVRGQKSAVEEMRRILTLMEQGRNYVRAGGKRERGVLMVGPPGTGKTMLAKGIASSMHVPIIITSGSSFQGMFLGMDALNVFMTVRAAKSRAKRWGGSIVFIDEFDALGNRRSGMSGGGAGGMGGMFGGGQLGPRARRDEFARVADGYSPAMIEQALSLALMYAFQDNREAFTWRDIREAMGNIEAGLAHPVVYTERERLAVARHELGHAVAARYFLPDAVSVRLSIKMRSGSLGHHRSVARQEEFSHFRSHAAGQLRHTLGAIASERAFYGENSNGVSMDLVQATELAPHMISRWGMGPDPLPMQQSRLAVSIGEYLISVAAFVGNDLLGVETAAGKALGNPRSRQAVAQVLGP